MNNVSSDWNFSFQVNYSELLHLFRCLFCSADSEYKVVSKWLEYYEDESTDEEIEPLVNRKTIRNKRMKILRESIKREKEERERKHEEMETKLLCLPGFPQGNVLEISDDDSS